MRAKEYIAYNQATLKHPDEIRQIVDEMRLAKSNPISAVKVFLDDKAKLTICNPEHELLLRKIIELLIPGKKIRELHFVDKEQHGLVI